MSAGRQVSIVGVGLIGGSIGKALRRADPTATVLGVGRSEASLRKALDAGAVTETTLSLPRAAARSEIVIVATPPETVAGIVRTVAEHLPRGGWITDAASVKATIAEDLQDVPAFVGSHPIAGSDRAGVEHARDDLFSGRLTVVTPPDGNQEELTDAVCSFWHALGSRTLVMDAREHDRLLAASSHLPHLAAAALAAATPEDALPFVGGGWRDATRIAGGEPELWRQILAANRPAVLVALDRLLLSLMDAREALADGDDHRLSAMLTAGQSRRLAGEPRGCSASAATED